MVIRVFSFKKLCERFVQATEPAFLERQRGYKHTDLVEAYRPKRQRKSTVRSGDKRLERLQDNLDKLADLGWRLSKQQQIMVNSMICAALPQIMQGDLQNRMEYLLEKFKVDQLKPEVLIKATRRLGKTTAAALFITAYANSQPNAQADIYSVARRTSVMFLAKIVKLLVMMNSGKTDFIVKYNQEEFMFYNEVGTISIIHSYPAASKISHPILLLSPSPPLLYSTRTPRQSACTLSCQYGNRKVMYKKYPANNATTNIAKLLNRCRTNTHQTHNATPTPKSMIIIHQTT